MEGEVQGAGVLVGARWLLTCAHVVEGFDEVELLASVDGEVLTTGTVVQRGNPEGPDDLALVELTKALPDRGILPFDHWTRGEDWHAVGFPKVKENVSGKVEGPSDYFDWLTIDSRSNRKVVPGFSGGAVWIAERGVAVALVAGYHGKGDGVAYGIPTDQILQFWPRLPATPNVDTQPIQSSGRLEDIQNVGLSRFVRILDDQQRVLGQGFRVGGDEVLTAWEVAAGTDELFVESPAAGRFQQRKAKVVWPESVCGKEPTLAVLESKVPQSTAPFDRWLKEPANPGQNWRAVGYGALKSCKPSERMGLRGVLKTSEESGWVLDLDKKLGPVSVEAAKIWMGSSVFVETVSGGWRLLGVLGLRVHGESWALEARPWDELPGDILSSINQRADFQEQSAYFLKRAHRWLRAESVREAVLENDPNGDWEAAAERGFEELAKHLCLKARPNDLTKALSSASEQLWDGGQRKEAEQAFHLLMDTLPVALWKTWRLSWPESTAKEVKISLFNRMLAELVLAGSESGAASFRDRPASSTTDEHRALHELERPGELGPDLKGDEGARELAREILDYLALEPSPEAEVGLDPFLARLASMRTSPRNPRFIDEEKRKRIEGRNPLSWRQEVIDAINAGLSERTPGGRRFLYLIADPQEPLMEGVRRLLPQLKIVTLGEDSVSPEATEKLLTQLKALFLWRTLRDEEP